MKNSMVNKMKNKILITVFCVLVFALCGCSKQENTKKSLSEQGMDVISLMDELVRSDAYTTLIGSDSFNEIRELIAAGDYTKASAIYEIRLPEDMLEQLLQAADEENTKMQLSNTAKIFLEGKSVNMLANQINAYEGTTSLAASSIYTAEKIFVNSELKENLIYLYTFETGYPVAVTFKSGEDNAVYATGTFLLKNDFTVDSVEAIQQLIEDIIAVKGYSVKKL